MVQSTDYIQPVVCDNKCIPVLFKVEGKKLVASIPALSVIPHLLSAADVKQALTTIDGCVMC